MARIALPLYPHRNDKTGDGQNPRLMRCCLLLISFFCLSFHLNSVFAAENNSLGNSQATEEILSETQQQNQQASSDAQYAEFVAPVYVNGEMQKEVLVKAQEDPEAYYVAAAELLPILEEHIKPEAVVTIQENTGDFINLEKLAVDGITATFNVEQLIIEIEVSPELRATRAIPLQGVEQSKPENYIAPNNFSAALTSRVVEDWYDYDNFLSADFDGNINLYGWVLESRYRFEEESVKHWKRQEAELVKDFESLPARLSVGDVNYPIIGLMGREDLSGISFNARFDLQPYEVAFPTFDQQLLLEEDSRVDIYVNGSKRRSIDLKAGVYDLVDIPVLDGVSDVVLEITDRFGRVKRLDYFGLQQRSLLKKGLSDYSFSMGVKRLQTEDGIDYENDEPIGSAFYRYGVTDRFTVNSHLEGTRDVWMGGLGGTNNTVLGDFFYEYARSRDVSTSETLNGDAWQVGYRYRNNTWAVGVDYTWQNEDFSRLGQFADDDNIRYIANASLSLPRIFGVTNTLSFNQSERWDGEKRVQARLNSRYDISRSWRVFLELTHTEFESERDNIVNVQFYWSPWVSRRWNGNVGYTTEENTYNYELQYQRDKEIGLNARVSGQYSDIQRRESFNADYLSSLFELRTNADENYNRETQDHSYRRSISLASSLVYVGGEFGLSRPVDQLPFAMFKGRIGLGEEGKVGIVRGRGGAPLTFVNGAKDTGVFSHLSPYYVTKLTLNTDDLPYGIDVEKQEFDLYTTYRSGTLVEVGNEAKMYATGFLLDSAGNPVSLALVKLHPLDGSTAETNYEFFTDEQGYFEADQMPGGKYQLSIGILPNQTTIIEIPRDKIGTIDLGTLKLSEKTP